MAIAHTITHTSWPSPTSVPPPRASAHGTPFVSRKSDRNDCRGNRSRETTDSRTEWEEISSPNAEDRVMIDALFQQRVCFFHARGSDCPHKSAARRGRCDFVLYGLYPRETTQTRGL